MLVPFFSLLCLIGTPGLEISAFRKDRGCEENWMDTTRVCRMSPCVLLPARQLHPEASQSEKQLAVIAFRRQYPLGRIWPVLACVW